MLIEHMPFGYVASRLLWRRATTTVVSVRAFILAGVLGSVAPDIDMLYFHLIDARQHNHHSYWTHFPVVWIGLLLASVLALRLRRQSAAAILGFVFCLNGFAHLLLDSVVGDIRWLAPWSQHAYSLFEVPPRYAIWWLNYVLHPFFLVEIAFVMVAAAMWRRHRTRTGVA
ncbi:MAG TPA: metal-dependent hydrolase [Rhodocyclaceae bacterium]|nr:metal-dependent hydrolase [Rhodocyclaceae bacterium]